MAPISPALTAIDPVRVAIAADNLRYRRSLELLLAHAPGFTLARSVARAEVLLSDAQSDDRPWDLVLMDLQLPGMSGIEATRRLKALDPTAAGNLLLHVLVAGAGPSSDTSFDCDFDNGLFSRAFNNSFGPTGFQADGVGLVTEFNTETVPEPATLALVGAGLAWLARARRLTRSVRDAPEDV